MLVHDPGEPSAVCGPRLAEQIRANARARAGRRRRSPGPSRAPPTATRFAAAYEQTMRRADAAERYFFGRAYFDAVLSFERSWLLVAGAAGEVGAAAIAAVSDGILHYYLGGTADSARDAVAVQERGRRDARPRRRARPAAQPRRRRQAAGDGLEEFKRGFANAELPFRTHEVVCDAEAYERLAAGREAAAAFFPRLPRRLSDQRGSTSADPAAVVGRRRRSAAR